MKNSSKRKPIPVQHDRGGTLRYAWLRAPPLYKSTKTTNPILSGCLTNHAPYEGGLSARRARAHAYDSACETRGGHGPSALSPPYGIMEHAETE